MKFRLSIIILLLTIFLAGCNQGSNIPNNTPLSTLVVKESPTPDVILFSAVTKEDATCYFGTNEGYNAFVMIPQFSIVSVLGQDQRGEWMLVTLEEFTNCWIQSSSLQLQTNDLLPFYSSLPLPVKTPIPSPTFAATQLANQTPNPTLGLTWKILKFECFDKKATRAYVDLNVSGGVPPYTYSQDLPMYARPQQVISIKVSSSTSDGEPSNIISFTIPRASDFKCDNEGNNPVIPAPTIKPITPTNTPVPPACRDGIDNDDDGNTDYPNDKECGSPDGNHETP